jgi:hypothetical protein
MKVHHHRAPCLWALVFLFAASSAFSVLDWTPNAVATRSTHVPSVVGATLVRIPESLPGYRFSVWAPQLIPENAVVNAGLRRSVARLVDQWRPWLRSHEVACRGTGRPCGEGTFRMRPIRRLISAGPLMVDALLATNVTCPGCATRERWSTVAVAPASGDSIDVFGRLFRGDQGLRAIGAQLRRDTAYYWASSPPVGCLTALWSHDHRRSAPWRRVSWWVAQLKGQRATVPTAQGLALGLNGDSFHEHCGRTFLALPYRDFEARLGPAGVWLADSFTYGTATPVRYPVKVQICPSSYGVTPRAVHLPPYRGAVIPEWMASQVSLYTDQTDRVEVLAPTRWRCDAGYGADGSGGITVWPAGDGTGRYAEGIGVFAQPACVSCQLELACPYFAAARHIWQQEYRGIGGCAARPPPGEIVTPVNGQVVQLVDHPGINGGASPSGGAYEAYGVAAFSQFGHLVGGSYVASCTLPGSNEDFCLADLQWIYIDYHY